MSHRLLLGTCLLWMGGGLASAEAQTPASATTPAPVTASAEDPLLAQVDQAIQVNGQRFLTANYHSPWQIFHGILAYRQDFQLKLGEQKVSAIEWVATSEPRFDNLPLLLITAHGAKFHPFTREYAFEGHPSQTLALLSESHLPVDYEFKIGDRKVTIGDFLNNTMMEVGVNPREEITWVLWALNNYLKSDAQWRNQLGQNWSIELLVQHQVWAAVVGGPCGGNHGLFALAKARDKYLKSGNQLRGVWLQADQKINQYIEYARLLQNPDGSFSSEFYKGRGYSQDMNTRFNTTGHTLEFLAVGLPETRLNEPWVRNAVNLLSKELIDNRRAQANPGPLYHSVNALRNYRDRVRKMSPEKPAEIASAPVSTPAPIPMVTPAPAVTLAPSETLAPLIPPPTTVQPKPATTAPKTPGIAIVKPALPTPPSVAATAPAPTAPRSNALAPPAPLVIAADDAIPAPLPAINPAIPPLGSDATAKAVLSRLIDPSRIQPGLLAAEAPVSALTPVNR